MAAETQLKQVMADILGVEMSSIDDASSMDTIPKWDSLNHLNLILALEESFNVSFTEEQVVEMLNYGLIKAVLQEHGVAFN